MKKETKLIYRISLKSGATKVIEWARTAGRAHKEYQKARDEVEETKK